MNIIVLYIHEYTWKLKKMRENHIKKYKPKGGGLMYDLSCTPSAF